MPNLPSVFPLWPWKQNPLYVVDLIDFEDLYRREYPGLVAVAAALSGASRDAEDLVQDTMVKALINWKRVQRLDRPGGWCHRVLLNICHNWRRRRGTEARCRSHEAMGQPRTEGPCESLVLHLDRSTFDHRRHAIS